MATNYTPPSLKVYQEFVPQLIGNNLPLYACILAPQYGLHRYEVADEQAVLGSNDPNAGNSYSEWPDKTSGSTVDVASSALWVQDATLKYHNFDLSGSDQDPGSDISWDGLLSDDGNRIRSHSLVFKTGNGTSRSTVYGTRDVQIGDYIKLQKGATVVETTVSGFIAEQVAAVTGTLSAATSNQAATSLAASVVENIGASNFSVAASAASYSGLAAGYPEDTYTVTVVSTDGTPLGTLVSIVSGSGSDDVSSYALSDSGTATACGTRGATFTLTDSTHPYSSSSESSASSESSSSSSSSNSSSSSESSSSERSSSSATMSSSSESSSSQSSGGSSLSSDWGGKLQIGDNWVVTVAQDYTLPAPVSGGTYTGTKDTNYLVTIVSGGTVGTDTITYKATTNNGFDSGLTTSVTTAGSYSAANYGVTVTFNASEQYVSGDVFVIPATAAAKGAFKTITLADKLTGWVTTDSFTTTLGLADSFLMDESNWAATATTITVTAGAAHVGTYLGSTAQFDILAGTLVMDYRELLSSNTTAVGFVDDIDDAETLLGPADVDNPLSLMVKAALAQSAGTAVYYIGVASEDEDGYSAALEVLTEVSEVYNLVPYNTDEDVLDVVNAHVTAMAAPDVSMFRVMSCGIDVEQTASYYTTLSTGSEILATVSGTTLLAADAKFVTEGIRAGDTIRINYRTDGHGGTLYDTYTVDTVTAEDELELVTGPTTAITVAIKMEVWRTATDLEYANNIADVAERYASRRVYAAWSDNMTFDGNVGVSQSYMAASIAGQRSGVAPHQPLSNVPLSLTYLDLDPVIGFGSTRLNLMASKGVWLVVKDANDIVFTRHQLSTDPTDINTQEQTITTNLDHIVRDYKSSLQDLYGRGNVSDGMLEQIRLRVHGVTNAITSRVYPAIIGPQLQDLDISRLEIDSVNRDQVWLEIEPQLPYPLNDLTVKFRVL
jgi:hypothetical protein